MALGSYPPRLLKEILCLAAENAVACTAGYVVLAAVARAVGGWLSDRLAGARILHRGQSLP